MTHQSEWASSQSIRLNNYNYPVLGNINESIMNIQPRKVNQGDPGPDDHPINSTWSQTDWTGGGQVKWGSPDVVTGRFDWSTAETERAKTISLPPLPTEWSDPGGTGGDSWCLGVFDNKDWVTWGSDVRYLVGSTWTDPGFNLTAAPVSKGVVFRPTTGALAGEAVFCIPESSSFDYIRATPSRTNVAKSAIDLVVWEERLYRIGTQGELECTVDLTTWSGLTYIPDGSVGRKLDVYLTVGGEQTIYVTTNQGVWVLDPLSGKLLQSELQYPRHPDQGRASAVWRGELWTSVGDGVHRYNRSTIGPAGPDRDDGLPELFRGVIVDFEPSYNALYALISGVAIPGVTSDDPYYLHTGDDYMTGDQENAGTLLIKWNGFGWHYVYSIPEGIAPSNVFVSDAGGNYYLYWAANVKIYRINLSRVYLNLKANVTVPVVETAEWESSWYNFGWEGQDKTVKSLEMFVDNGSDTEIVSAWYKVDQDSSSWVQIGSTDGEGEFAWYFGPEAGAAPGSEDVNDYDGIRVERIKLKFILSRDPDNTYARPEIKWFVLTVRKILRPVRTFRMVLDLRKNQEYTPKERKQLILDAVKSTTANTMVYQNERIKVDVVAVGFKTVAEGTNKNAYVCQINMIETNETIHRT